MRACFVILHYLAAEMTSRCIDSILGAFLEDNVSLVVVDNASPDGSGLRLREKYASDRVHFILLDTNEGFARGNNAGYRHAVEHFSPDFIIVMNNDVIIEDTAFIARIEGEYEKEPFAVLGPDIFCPGAGVSQSPVRLEGMTLQQARALREKMYLKGKYFLYNYLSWKIKVLLHLASPTNPSQTLQYRLYPQNGCVLHGACYIFSKDFISHRPLAFNPATFLYCEEDILHLECIRSGLKIRYCPSIKVLHYEDSSTNAAFVDYRSRSRMKYHRAVESLDVFISLLNG